MRKSRQGTVTSTQLQWKPVGSRVRLLISLIKHFSVVPSPCAQNHHSNLRHTRTKRLVTTAHIHPQPFRSSTSGTFVLQTRGRFYGDGSEGLLEEKYNFLFHSVSPCFSLLLPAPMFISAREWPLKSSLLES